jgi:hypothetical protein
MDVLATPAAGKRFWPAFLRFLALLILLGIISSGAVYMYVNYFQG